MPTPILITVHSQSRLICFPVLTDSAEASEIEDQDVYHASPFGTARPSSESSHSNSDEWIEVSDTESEQTVYLYVCDKIVKRTIGISLTNL